MAPGPGTSGVRVIAGRYRGRRLETPDGEAVRPTADRVKEALFSILGLRIPGARVLDLFAGSGALGIEALSRGADRVTWVEADAGNVARIERNLARLGSPSGTRVLRADARTPEAWEGELPVDLILADPPYHRGLVEELLAALDPARALAGGGMLVVEHEAGLTHASAGWTVRDRRRYGGTELSFLVEATDRKA